MQFEVIEDPADIRALEADWRALFEARPGCSYFQSFDYLSAAWECVARPRGRRLTLVVGKFIGRVVLIWPLVSFTDRHARWLGSEKTEYRDVLVLPSPNADAWVLAAWKFIELELGFDWLLLQDVKDDGVIAHLLETHAIAAHKVSKRSRFLDCGAWESWQEFLASRSRKLRADQRRQWRRLEELGTVDFCISGPETTIKPTINWMIDRKVEWFERSGMDDHRFGSPENRNFIVAAAETAYVSGNLFLATLCIDTRPVAVVYSIVFRSAMTFICFSYDFDYEKYSPGRLAMARMLEWAFDRKLAMVDFMPSEPKYKYAWTNAEFGVSDWLVPCTRRGRFIAAWDVSKTRRFSVGLFAKMSSVISPRLVPPAIRTAARRILLIDAG